MPGLILSHDLFRGVEIPVKKYLNGFKRVLNVFKRGYGSWHA